MGRRRRTLVWACPVALAVAVGGVTWYRLSRVTAESDPQAYLARQGAIAYARMPSALVTDGETISAAFKAAPIEDPAGLLAGRADLLASLRTTAVEYLLARLNAQSAGEYIQRMEGRGYRFLTARAFGVRFGPLKTYSSQVGVESDDVRRVFEAMWSYGPSAAARPNALCTGDDSIVVSIGESRPGIPFTNFFEGTLGSDLWKGGSAATCRFWMSPPVMREELVKTRRRVLAAQVGVIACVPGSDRRPLIVSLFADPATGRWWVDGVSVTNYTGNDRVWTCTEF